jgi:hypothetical protein
MTKIKKLKSFKSITNFKNQIERTYLFIQGLEYTVIATETLLEELGAKNSSDYPKYQKYIEFGPSKKDHIFELGFIALFANFEFFMYDFLKNLFVKYPHSVEKDKNISLEEIFDFKSVKEVKKYCIDVLAIEKSYNIKSWSGYLMNKFGIKVFKNKKQMDRLLMLGALRNVLMHGGGITNSKFRNEMRGLIKSRVPLEQTISLKREKYFWVLYKELEVIIKGLEAI